MDINEPPSELNIDRAQLAALADVQDPTPFEVMKDTQPEFLES